MTPIESKWIVGYEYDKGLRVLTLYTKDGREMEVPNATEADVVGLTHAYSAGRYFHETLRHRVKK